MPSTPTLTATPAIARYRADALVAFAHALLARAGVRDDIARDVASVLVDGDLLGHTTHGLALLAPISPKSRRARWRRRASRRSSTRGPPRRRGTANRLPGPWLTLRAFDAAAAMAATYGTGTVVIRRSHHIACLAAYLQAHDRPRPDGAPLLLRSVDDAASRRSAACRRCSRPIRSRRAFRRRGDPILLDISASFTTNGLTGRLYKAGEKLPHPWVQDAQGNATDDPAVLFNDPKGTLLPLGGLEAGHKGYALALLVEALTAGSRASAAPIRRRLGRDRVRAGARSRGVRRRRRIRAADGLARRRVPRRDAAARRRTRAPAGRERHEALSRAAGRTASRCSRASCRRCSRGRKSSASRCRKSRTLRTGGRQR